LDIFTEKTQPVSLLIETISIEGFGLYLASV